MRVQVANCGERVQRSAETFEWFGCGGNEADRLDDGERWRVCSGRMLRRCRGGRRGGWIQRGFASEGGGGHERLEPSTSLETPEMKSMGEPSQRDQ